MSDPIAIKDNRVFGAPFETEAGDIAIGGCAEIK
jgi:hypothetical protein